MVATLEWFISENSIADFSTVSSLRFRNANYNTGGNADPLVRPTSGVNYSFEKALRIYVTVAPDNELQDLRVKSSTNDPGGTTPGPALSIRQAYRFDSVYTQPQQYSGGTGGIGGEMIGKEGNLTQTEVPWTGAADPMSTFAPIEPWDSSEFLYCQLELDPGNGGSITSWDTIAVYNEL